MPSRRQSQDDASVAKQILKQSSALGFFHKASAQKETIILGFPKRLKKNLVMVIDVVGQHIDLIKIICMLNQIGFIGEQTIFQMTAGCTVTLFVYDRIWRLHITSCC